MPVDAFLFFSSLIPCKKILARCRLYLLFCSVISMRAEAMHERRTALQVLVTLIILSDVQIVL